MKKTSVNFAQVYLQGQAKQKAQLLKQLQKTKEARIRREAQLRQRALNHSTTEQ